MNNVSGYNRKVATSDLSIEEYNAKQDDGYALKRVIKTNKEKVMTRDEMFIIFDQIRNANDITEKELLMHKRRYVGFLL